MDFLATMIVDAVMYLATSHGLRMLGAGFIAAAGVLAMLGPVLVHFVRE